MSTFRSWLFRSRRTEEGSGGVALPRPRPDKAGQEQQVASWTTSGPLFIDFEALAQRPNALLEGLTPVSAHGALLSFVGTGITDPSRYQDAAAAFSRLRPMAPLQEGALIQVFRHQLREESRGNDFLYLHFAGDPLSFGCLICPLTGGGLMTGWKLG